MKIRMTFTIDEDLADTLKRNHGSNMSEVVNEMISKALANEQDINDRLREVDIEFDNIRDKRDSIRSSVERLVIEGNLEERQKSEKLLKEISEKRRIKKEKLQKIYDTIKGSTKWKEFLERHDEIKDDNKALSEFAGDFQEEGYRIGVVQLRDFFEYLDIQELKNVQK